MFIEKTILLLPCAMVGLFPNRPVAIGLSVYPCADITPAALLVFDSLSLPTLFLILKVALAILDFLCFYITVSFN